METVETVGLATDKAASLMMTVTRGETITNPRGCLATEGEISLTDRASRSVTDKANHFLAGREIGAGNSPKTTVRRDSSEGEVTTPPLPRCLADRAGLVTATTRAGQVPQAPILSWVRCRKIDKPRVYLMTETTETISSRADR